MKLTANSHKMLDFFTKNGCILSRKQTKKTNSIFEHIYYEMKDAFNYIDTIIKDHVDFYTMTVEDITHVSQIPKPSTFPPNSFPLTIRNQIDETIQCKITFSTKLFDRSIKVYFLLEDGCGKTALYVKYFKYMLAWIYILTKHASQSCAESLTVFVYHTSLAKLLPKSNIDVLGEEHVNTAFTATCPKKSEIVVFRKEEWFKVFMHETFHNFGLDFSDMNNEVCNQLILSIFPVNTDVNLYEAYTEFWARIMNSLFCSYVLLKDKNKDNVKQFLKNSEFFINMEIMYSYFQTVKVLDFMGLDYSHLFNKSKNAQVARNSLYKENTSVLAYYVITLILMNNYQSLLEWCLENNASLFQFKKTVSNQTQFCKFIEKNYNKQSMLSSINCARQMLLSIQNARNKSKFTYYILNNLRMTLCELE